MKQAIQIRLRDDAGTVYKWSIRWVKGAYLTGTALKKGRHADGWEYTDHENYTRFTEGNWLDLVAAFKATAANYGFTLCSELS